MGDKLVKHGPDISRALKPAHKEKDKSVPEKIKTKPKNHAEHTVSQKSHVRK